jgi:Protein of unknown function (DUF2931)
MSSVKRLIVIIGGVLLSGGTMAQTLPYDAWRLGFFAPTGMEVWVETADVEDIRGKLFPRAGSGTVSIGYSSNPRGWPAHISFGAGRNVTGADLPKRISVRWQSLVEPQTYSVTFDIPDSARELMRHLEYQPKHPKDRTKRSFREYVVVGLAPGGIARMWLKGPGLVAVPIQCKQAEVEPKGPDLGEHGGRYVTLSERALPYISTQSIPYESWRCENLPNNGSS